MVSLFVHALLGVAVLAFIVRSNSAIFTRFQTGPQVSALELFYYVVGVASIALGYYFNYHYVQEYVIPSSNPIWGPGSWQEFIALGYTNPAASSASEDYTIMSLLIFPVFAIVDGRRRGITCATSSLLTSTATTSAASPIFPMPRSTSLPGRRSERCRHRRVARSFAFARSSGPTDPRSSSTPRTVRSGADSLRPRSSSRYRRAS